MWIARTQSIWMDQRGVVRIQVIHLISNFALMAGSQELTGKAIDFLRGRDDLVNKPYPVKLFTEMAWKLSNITCALDPIPMLAFYNADIADKEKY